MHTHMTEFQYTPQVSPFIYSLGIEMWNKRAKHQNCAQLSTVYLGKEGSSWMIPPYKEREIIKTHNKTLPSRYLRESTTNSLYM